VRRGLPVPRRWPGVVAVIAMLVLAVGAIPAHAGGHGRHAPDAPPLEAVDAEGCPDLQALIDATSAGGRLAVPPCTYRASMTIDRPIHLVGSPGVLFLGSDAWTAWDGRRSVERLPEMEAHGQCLDERPGCERPEAVYRDDQPLERVAGTPGPGQFRVLADRRIELGEDPGDAAIEVVVRDHWLDIQASDVTVEGITMRYAANPAQTGAVRAAPGIERLAMLDCELSHAHGANIAFGAGDDGRIERCDIHHAGQLGIHVGGDGRQSRGNAVRDTVIRDNNTAGFDPEWEAGGLKATRQTDLVLAGNVVHDNAGPGLWCDIDCRSIEITGNVVRDNTHAGIFFEISEGAAITGNTVSGNGWGKPEWAWGAGILVSSSSGADVRGNTVAWNAAGITVITQDRADAPGPSTGIAVRDNVVVGHDDRFLTAWLEDWSGGTLFEPASANGGGDNRYRTASGRPETALFAWDGPVTGMAAAAATPAEGGSRFLSGEEATALLDEAGIADGPARPEVHDPIPRELRAMDRDMLRVMAILAGLAVAGVIGAFVLRRWRRPRETPRSPEA
jgi:parallel beta-helix repeat protein